jgi:gliding motility-associated-like protein
MRTLVLVLFLLIFKSINAQTITVDDTGFSPQQLVDLLLSTSCATTSNINVSSTQSVAYFNGNGSVFPIGEGIIIRNGIAANTAGLYTNTNLSSEVNTNGDPDLQAISDATGQPAVITDVAFLEFDFVPSSTQFSFDFLFASNEYGQYQCGFSDVFAFLLTDLNTGVTTNIAVIPGTTTPISIRDIRDQQYNPECTSENPELFSTYNVNNAAASALNMRGHTVVLNASSPVIPNNPYRIKLAIGDYNDSTFDSAVFIEAGSFDSALDIGPDQALCDGDDITLDSGYTNTVDFSYEWQLDGVTIAGEINPSLNVIQAGTYTLIITTLATGCTLTDEAIISDLVTNEPTDLLECDSGGAVNFNLTLNGHGTLGIDPAQYDIFYYDSLDNANNNIPIDAAQVTSYAGNDGDTIYIRLQNTTTGNFCNLILDFNLIISGIEAGIADDFSVCQDDTTVNLVIQTEAQILNGLDPNSFTVTYFTSEADALTDTNAIPDPENFTLSGTLDPVTLWARLTDDDVPICFDTSSFTITVNPSPPVDDLPTVFVCTEFTLPALTNGNYFTETGGGGTPLFAGDVITDQTVIFIYNENAQGCSSETSFGVNMADEYTMPTQYCGQFIVPSYPNATFHLSPSGDPADLVPAGTVFTSNVTIYFYAIDADDNSFCAEFGFDIEVLPLPQVEERDDVVNCDEYILPPTLFGERYFTETNGPFGSGTELFPGDAIATSQTIFLYGINTAPIVCTNESSFQIDIIDTSIFDNIEECGQYVLPDMEFGGYFTQPLGAGDPIAEGTVITSSQTIFYYAPEVTEAPNCTDNLQIDIVIRPLPPVDSLADIVRCQDDLPVLQPLTNGQYYTETGGPGGTGTQLFAGDVINSSQQIFIYNSNAFCDDETSFNVEIRPFPPVDNFTDIFSCEPYVLPVLTNGRYFTEAGGPNGPGVELNGGDVINVTQPLYIYNEWDDLPGCISENVFTVEILTVEVDEPADVEACESYVLPPLTVGDYFTEPDGEGDQLNAGDVITSTQALYVYAENGDRFVCTDEHEFTITIFNIPTLPDLPNLEGCESVELPVLDIPGVTVEYYRRPNREDLIAPGDFTITALGSRIIYVYAYATGFPDCSTESLFQVTVYPLRDLEIEGGTICVNPETGDALSTITLESGLDESEFTVNWFLNGELVGTGSDYIADAAGTYTVETIKLTVDVGAECNFNPTEVVVESSAPQFEINFLTEVFAARSTIEIVTVDAGSGFYQFSLDSGPFQEFNRFYDIAPGEHFVTIRDLSGFCGDFVIPFNALGYPLFFTPNDDGFNDTWNIPDLQNDLDATIKIFNRLGRPVAEIRPSGQGWNGFNNSGRKEPSSDYWFLVEFTYNGVPTSFHGHFSLLRR